MALTRLGISHFRNLHQVDLDPAEDLNLIIGNNASGKTSLLEALYFLGRARSFRTNRFDRIVEKGQDKLIVYGQQKYENGKKVPFGVQKGQKTLQIRINEQKIAKVSELVRFLPLQLIHPNSHQLLEEGPSFRRHFLDWGVFHVEQGFYSIWQRYQSALKQRNKALRDNAASDLVTIWDRELVETAGLLDQMRRTYLQDLEQLSLQYIEPVLGKVSISIDYLQGWNRQMTLQQALGQNLVQDRERGFTGVGPHRADISVKLDGVLAKDRISRGQQKIMVTSLLLAQAALYNEKTGKKCILLIDDVAAELDSDNRLRLMQQLQTMKVQMFITSIEKDMLLPMRDYSGTCKMFHVEHGRVTDML